jgi:hypothetical protein
MAKPLDPAKFAEKGTEHAHQVALFIWISQHQTEYPELMDAFAIPNGGERNIIVAANLKAEGVKASTPDIFLPVARAGCNGLFIELKRPKSLGKAAGKATEEQSKTIDKLRCNGYGACVCIGWEAARDVLIQYITWKG